MWGPVGGYAQPRSAYRLTQVAHRRRPAICCEVITTRHHPGGQAPSIGAVREPAPRRTAIFDVPHRFSDMGDERGQIVGYVSRLVSGLVACAVVAATLHAHIAAAMMLGAVMLVVLGVTCLMLRRAL